MTTETKTEELLRRTLPNFMQMHDEMVAELHYLRTRTEDADYMEDDIEALKAENRALRAELDAMKKDREFVV